MGGITWADYRRATDREWAGCKVRSLRAVKTGLAELPAGSVFTVTRKFKGFALISDACPCCGLQMKVKEAEPGWFELFPTGELGL